MHAVALRSKRWAPPLRKASDGRASRCSASAIWALVEGPCCFSSRAAWRARRFGFLAIARSSQATAGPRGSLAHSLSTKWRTSSFEGSAPKTTRHELSAPSSTRSTIPTQNCPSKHTTRVEDTAVFRMANSSFM